MCVCGTQQTAQLTNLQEKIVAVNTSARSTDRIIVKYPNAIMFFNNIYD